MFQDLRHSIRMLLKRPGFTLRGGCDARAWNRCERRTLQRLQPLDASVAGQGAGIDCAPQARKHRSSTNLFSFPDYAYFRDHNQSFSDVLAVFEEERFLLGENTPKSDPEEILGNFVSDNYFAMLGGSTHLGRSFTPEENSVPGRDAVVVLSYNYWQRRFGGDAQLVGRSHQVKWKTVYGNRDNSSRLCWPQAGDA